MTENEKVPQEDNVEEVKDEIVVDPPGDDVEEEDAEDTSEDAVDETVAVPVRQLEVHQADDGRRVEVFQKTGEIPFVKRSGDEDDETPEFSDLEAIYIGVVHVFTNYGPKEIKFQIPDVDSVEDAFEKYYELADIAIADLEKKIKDAQKESENKIVTAPAAVLDAFNKVDDDDIAIR